MSDACVDDDESETQRETAHFSCGVNDDDRRG